MSIRAKLVAAAAVFLVLAVVGLYFGPYRARSRIPDVPRNAYQSANPTRGMATSPKRIVTAYEEAVRKKNVEVAWALFDEEQRKALDFEKFGKAAQALPAEYKKFKVLEPVKSKTKSSWYQEYAKHMSKKLLDKSWFVLVEYPEAKKFNQTAYLVVPHDNEWRIIDIRQFKTP